jgi:hypothetical protein
MGAHHPSGPSNAPPAGKLATCPAKIEHGKRLNYVKARCTSEILADIKIAGTHEPDDFILGV